jgi:type I restriction enzyme S subunit
LSRSEDLDIEYLYWLLQSEDIWPKRGSAQPFISQTDAREVSVALPPPAQQHAIAEVLGALDDKIEANRRIESLCWSLARAQFEAAIATADELVPLSSLLKLEYGKALPAGVRRLGPTPVYGSGGIVGRHDKPLVTGPGVIVGRKGTAGSVHWSQRAFFPIDTTFYVTNVSVPMVFAYFALRCLRLDSMNSDSAVPGLNRNTAMCQMVPLPGKEDLATFGGRAEVLVDAAEATASESCALETLRDTLLPELVTGELRVRDAEALVEEAV